MRKHIIIGLVIVVALLSFGMSDSKEEKKVEIIELESKPIQPVLVEEIQIPEVDNLINALIMVESNGNDSAVGDVHLGEPSIGVLQIRPIMVREVNRILGIQKSELEYTLEDRWSREKSIEMFHIVNNYHNKNSRYEEIARAWNGGPNWAEKSLTKRYWKRVQQQLKKQKKKKL